MLYQQPMPVSVPVQGGNFPQTSQQQGSGGSVVLLQPSAAHTSIQQPTGRHCFIMLSFLFYILWWLLSIYCSFFCVCVKAHFKKNWPFCFVHSHKSLPFCNCNQNISHSTNPGSLPQLQGHWLRPRKRKTKSTSCHSTQIGSKDAVWT